jgi:RNA polymerase sigma factor (sigma-70 family)
VTQQVVIALAGEAAALAKRDALQGWLLTAVRYAAARIRRTEQRRREREQKAHVMNDLTSDSARDAEWLRLRPVLDAALDRLDERDRTAVFLRYFEGKSFADIGVQLRLTENAVRMRVERALNKMEATLARKGVTSTAAGLGVALAYSPAYAAPEGLALSVTSVALTKASAAGAPVVLALMSSTKITIGFAAVLLLAAAGWLSQYRTNVALRQEVAALHRAIEHAPAREVETKSAAAPSFDRPPLKTPIAPAQAAAPDVNAPDQTSQSIPTTLLPVAAWQNRGTSTARDALESYLWAVEQVDAEVTAKTIGFGTLRPEVEAYFNGLSDAVREKYHTPEELWAAVLTGAPHGPAITAFQILSQRPEPTLGPNFVELRVRTQKAGGAFEEGDIRLELTPDGWRRSLDDRGRSLIDPVKALFQSTAKTGAARGGTEP